MLCRIENLPFWGEKLPELPDLVYDYLKTGKETALQQQLTLAAWQAQQLKQHKSVRYLIIAGSLLVIASHFYINTELVLASSSAIFGALFSYLGLRK